MKKLAQKNLRTAIAVAALGLFTIGMNAQVPPPPAGNTDPPDTELPINGFIGIALVAGAYFGAKKLKSQQGK